jgi:Heterokaryon incompatibility protein (HET)
MPGPVMILGQILFTLAFRGLIERFTVPRGPKSMCVSTYICDCYGQMARWGMMSASIVWRIVSWFSGLWRVASGIVDIVNALRNYASSEQRRRRLTNLEPYHYSPLPSPSSVRLLEIHPGTGEEIRCSLNVADLRDNPRFNALSYTWADPRPSLLQSFTPHHPQNRHPILCDGRVIYVTTNLYHGLRRLCDVGRHQNNTSGIDDVAVQTRIWIDAVCINQEDLAERSAQVAVMDDIYKAAGCVFAWLGTQDRYTETAIRRIKELAQVPREQYPQYRSYEALSQISRIPTEDWEAVVAFLSRAWFKRAWVVQEVVLAQRLLLLCGCNEVPWDDLIKCSDYLFETSAWKFLIVYAEQFSSMEDRLARSLLPPIAFSVKSLAFLKGRLSNKEVSITFLLMYGRAFHTSHKPDHVFAMLGLVKEKMRLNMSTEHPSVTLPIPDYTKPVEEIFCDCAWAMLDETKDLFLLSFVEDRKHRSADLVYSLPTWVPDLSVVMQPAPLWHQVRGRPWKPAGTDDLAPPIQVDRRCLHLKGAFFGIVTSVCTPFDELYGTHRWFEMFFFLKPLSTALVSATTMGDALWRTLIADSDGLSFNALQPANPLLGVGFGEWLVTILLSPRISQSNDSSRKNYLAVNKKRILSVWDQLRHEGINSFKGETFAQYKRFVAMRMRSYRQDTRPFKTKHDQKSENDVLVPANLVALLHLAESDPTKIIPNRARIDEMAREHVGMDIGNEGMDSRVARTLAFEMASSAIMASRRLFVTESNDLGTKYLGIGAQSAQVGDQVWILPGARVPFILRPCQNGWYQLVGEAYVHSIMEGEAVASGSLKFEDIVLK